MRPTLHNLQALRGLACLLVVFYHAAGWELLIWSKWHVLTPVRWFGYAGVDLFFVLSGFIIAWTHLDQLGQARKLPRYLVRRAWRIYPVLWASAVLAAVLASAATNAAVFTPGWLGDWMEWLTLVPRPDSFRFIAAAWSLNYEALFYAAFALLFLVPRRAAPWLGGGWAVAILLARLTAFTPTPFWAAMALSPFVLEFLAGALVAAVVRRGAVNGARTTLFAAVAWLAVVVPLARGDTPDDLGSRYWPRVLAFGPPCALIVYAAVAGEMAGRVKLPRRLRPVGDASYSIYLVHGPVGLAMLFATWGISHDLLPHLLWLAILMGSGVAAGWAVYRLVERPLLKRGKRATPEPTLAEAAVHVHVPADGANRRLDQFQPVADLRDAVPTNR